MCCASPRALILIPAFDAADTIVATLDSVQAQGSSLAALSAVCLADDCSRDQTVHVAQAAWPLAAPPLRVLRAQRNLGQWTNVNRALRSVPAELEWVLLLHADDLTKPGWLDTMVSRMTSCEPNVGSICSSWDMLLPDGRLVGGDNHPARPVQVIRGTREAVRDTVLSGCWWHISGCAIRLRAFTDVGDFDPALAFADWAWLLRCLERGWHVEYVPKTLIAYRQHARSVSSTSIQRDQDIHESLALFRHYAPLLTVRQRCGLHLREATFASRRLGRALLRRQPTHAVRHMQTIGRIGASLNSSLLRLARGQPDDTDIERWPEAPTRGYP